jgi:hypothetical protein
MSTLKLSALLLALVSSSISSDASQPTEPVLYAEVCSTVGECAWVNTIANDCRQLTTPLYDILPSLRLFYIACL